MQLSGPIKLISKVIKCPKYIYKKMHSNSNEKIQKNNSTEALLTQHGFDWHININIDDC